MGLIKTDKEVELIRQSCKLLAEVKQVLWDAVKPGISTLELDVIAEKEIIKRGATPAFKYYQGYPNSICASVNDTLIHGIPSANEIIKDGDVVSIDVGLIWKKYYSDSAFTKGVGTITKKDQDLIDVAKRAFYLGVDAIKPGARVGDISYAIGKYIKSKGYFTPPNFTGHGIGLHMHEDPSIPNVGYKGSGPLLKDNMVICIEPMILQHSADTITLVDGWTIKSIDGSKATHYEHTILIKDGKGEILTEGI